ncbi:hypothetical protein CMQ_1572 [Grosmannia clavigera kw1407]|uniref:Zn(2)-C6 fungal-type domain-containing protein n=1 Tax=Grosmannia clavigera (strain kw1407 / UAMH 11150) TaxID=655863 RepID=F0XCU6_GROCL|nr:uncharacterized protein CMQ_1572 [Grosmannia clavigera kw1407]EFX04644.1 hypothetical protein CMQ_1572 [Grosmannia clavigera kw1407]
MMPWMRKKTTSFPKDEANQIYVSDFSLRTQRQDVSKKPATANFGSPNARPMGPEDAEVTIPSQMYYNLLQEVGEADKVAKVIERTLAASDRTMDDVMRGDQTGCILVVMTESEQQAWRQLKHVSCATGEVDCLYAMRESLAGVARVAKQLELRFDAPADEGVRQQNAFERLAYEAEHCNGRDKRDAHKDSKNGGSRALANLNREAEALLHRMRALLSKAEAGVVPFCRHVMDLGAVCTEGDDDMDELTALDVVRGSSVMTLLDSTLRRMSSLDRVNAVDLARTTWSRCDARMRNGLGDEPRAADGQPASLLRRWLRLSGSREFHHEQVRLARGLQAQAQAAGCCRRCRPSSTETSSPQKPQATSSSRRSEPKIERVSSSPGRNAVRSRRPDAPKVTWNRIILYVLLYQMVVSGNAQMGILTVCQPAGIWLKVRCYMWGLSTSRKAAALMDEKAKATAKWGAACSACASAKVKCIRSVEDASAKCDRCERLFKNCAVQVHRARKKRTSKTSKTAQLEERLNGLVDLLRASGDLLRASGDLNTLHAAEASPHTILADPSRKSDRLYHADTTDVSSRPPPQDVQQEQLTAQIAIPVSYNSFAPPTCICRPESGEIITTAVDSDEDLLKTYRSLEYPHYPFVAVASDVTAEQLMVERPILMMAIRAVASVDNSRFMQGAMYRLICLIADRVILQSDRSLDLVQGMLVVVGWYQYHCMMHAQLNNLLHLGISMMADLGLNRPPRIAERTHILVLHPNIPSPRANEERRLVLGYWYMSSCLSLGFLKIEAMRFSPYVRQCLDELDEISEYPSDARLVTIVRLQHLAEKVARFNRPEELGDEIPGISRAPSSAYQLAFQNELDRLCQALPEDIKTDKLIQNQINTIKLRLYEPPLLDATLLQKFSADFTAVSSNNPSGLDILYRSYNALRGWFDQWFTIPVSQYHWVPIPLCVQLVYGITMLSRWARLVGAIRPAHTDLHDSTINMATAVPPSSSSTLKDPSSRLVPGQGVPVSSSCALPTSSVVQPAVAAIAGLDGKEIACDPKLKAAMAQMRDTLRNQPGLLIDISALLTALGDRFEQSNLEMRAASAAKFGDSADRGMNIWDLTSRKIAILRSKLGPFLDDATTTEMTTQQQQQHNQLNHHAAAAFPIEGSGFPVDHSLDVNLASGIADAATDSAGLMSTSIEGWDCNSPWANEIFEDMEASLWLESLPWVPIGG